jgi:hypothetical protein
MLYQGGKVVDRIVGAAPKAELEKFINKWVDSAKA